jgi:hypothetical protein
MPPAKTNRKDNAGAKDESQLVRIIQTKYTTYVLPASVKGIPITEYFPGVTFPEPMKGGKVYQTEDGPVIAMTAKSLRRPLRRKRTPKTNRDPI